MSAASTDPSVVERAALADRTGRPDMRRHRFGRRWLATFLAYPPAGLLAIAVVDRVDDTPAALLGGAIVGAGIGLAQAVALRPGVTRRGFLTSWVGATTLATAVGLAIGSGAVDHRTTMAALGAMGLITGIPVGLAQGALLRRADRPSRGTAWALLQPLLYGLGWVVTTAAGVDVERQYAVFGATGALAAAAVGAWFHRGSFRPDIAPDRPTPHPTPHTTRHTTRHSTREDHT